MGLRSAVTFPTEAKLVGTCEQLSNSAHVLARKNEKGFDAMRGVVTYLQASGCSGWCTRLSTRRTPSLP